MKLYKKMVRPYALEAAWQGMTSAKTPLADWMDEEEKTEALEKEMSQKCKELDRMSSLVWEEKYESCDVPYGGDEVFIVTEGEYSDYHIEEVFATQKDAELYIATRTSNNDYWGQYYIDKWIVSAGNIQSSLPIQHLFKFLPNKLYKGVLRSDALGFPIKPYIKKGWNDKEYLAFSYDSDECPVKVAADIYAKLKSEQGEEIPEEVKDIIDPPPLLHPKIGVPIQRENAPAITIPIAVVNAFQKNYGAQWEEKLKEAFNL